MYSCQECPLDKKLSYCCLTHPETVEQENITIGEIIFSACPNFTENENCSIYESRPDACKSFDCEKYPDE
ncbi:MAG: hypothetical protein KJ597_05805 [Nanoarchaeota archaeon]|nr:hypothetical protein [Nanoarchaeota archaeon]